MGKLIWNSEKSMPGGRKQGFSVCKSGTNVYLFGGEHKNVFSSELLRYHLPSQSWNVVSFVNGEDVPPGLSHHYSAANGENLYFFGGTTQDGVSNSILYIFNCETATWTQSPVNNPAVFGAQCCSYEEGFLLFGGQETSTGFLSNQIYLYNIKTSKWDTVVAENSPAARKNHAMAIYKNKLFVLGGELANEVPDDSLYVLELDKWVWSTLPIGGKPHINTALSMTIIENNLLVVGEADGSAKTLRSPRAFSPLKTSAKDFISSIYFGSGELTWERINNAEGKPPTSLADHTSVTVGTKIFLFTHSTRISSVDCTMFNNRQKRRFSGPNSALSQFLATRKPKASKKKLIAKGKEIEDKYSKDKDSKADTVKIKASELQVLFALIQSQREEILKHNIVVQKMELQYEEEVHYALQNESKIKNLENSISFQRKEFAALEEEFSLLKPLLFVPEEIDAEEITGYMERIEENLSSIQKRFRAPARPMRPKAINTKHRDIEIEPKIDEESPKLRSSSIFEEATVVAKEMGISSEITGKHVANVRLLCSLNESLEEENKVKQSEEIPKEKKKAKIFIHKLVRQASSNTRLKGQNKKSNPEQYKRVLAELIETEKSFCSDLLCCSSTYISELRKILTVEELETLFGNQEELMQLSKEILTVLEKEQKKKKTEQDFGSVFLTFSGQIQKVYSPYCGNLVLARHLKNRLSDTRSGFVETLTRMQQDPLVRRENINSFMIKPLQRLCKYPLLLKEMLKCNVNPAACKTLKAGYDAMQTVLDEVNNTMLEQDKLEPLLEIQDLFENIPIDIVQPNRVLVKRGYLLHWVDEKKKKRREKHCLILLFNDVILIAEETFSKAKNMNISYLSCVIPVSSCEFIPGRVIPERVTLGNSQDFFMIRNAKSNGVEEWGTNKFLFLCEDTEVKKKWVTIFGNVMARADLQKEIVTA